MFFVQYLVVLLISPSRFSIALIGKALPNGERLFVSLLQTRFAHNPEQTGSNPFTGSRTTLNTALCCLFGVFFIFFFVFFFLSVYRSRFSIALTGRALLVIFEFLSALAGRGSRTTLNRALSIFLLRIFYFHFLCIFFSRSSLLISHFSFA